MDVGERIDGALSARFEHDAELESEGRWLVVGVSLFLLVSVGFAFHGYIKSNMAQTGISGIMATISGLLLVGVDLGSANSTHTKYLVSTFVMGICSVIVMLTTCYYSDNPEATAMLTGSALMALLTCILAVHVGMEDPSDNSGIKDAFILAVFFAVLFSVLCSYASLSFLDAKVEAWRVPLCSLLLLISVFFSCQGLLALGAVFFLSIAVVPFHFHWQVYGGEKSDKKLELPYTKVNSVAGQEDQPSRYQESNGGAGTEGACAAQLGSPRRRESN